MDINPQIRDKILNAVAVLQHQGITSPTNEQVRECLGGGSLSHISPVMREWRESHQSNVMAVFDMPSELKRTIETALAQIWSTASKLSAQRIEAIQAESTNRVEMANAERDEALLEISHLESTLAALKQTLESQSMRQRELDVVINQKSDDLQQLAADKASLAAHLNEKVAAIEDLKATLSEAREDNQALQKELLAIARQSLE